MSEAAAGGPPADDFHARVRTVFLAAADLPPVERAAFVARACGDDALLAAEVRSLLRFHSPHTLIKAPSPQDDGTPRGSGLGEHGLPVAAGAAPRWWRRNLRVAIGLLLAATAFAALLIAAQAQLRRALQAGVMAHMDALADAGATGVSLWIGTQEALVSGWAQDDQVARDAAALADAASAPDAAPDGAARLRDALLAQPALGSLRARLAPVARAAALRGWGVVTPDGRILATHGVGQALGRDVLGERLPAPMRDAMAPLFAGRERLLLPFDVSAQAGNAAPPDVVLTVFAPLRAPGGPAGAPPCAVLAFLVRPERDFTTILKGGGESGEVYAFDRTGLLVSESRFDAELRRAGLMPDAPGARSALAVRLRDPGMNLVDAPPGAAASLSPPLAERPLTRMAREATAGRNGSDADGYRDYRGVTVVGSWRWLEDEGLGIAAEMDRDEAFAALASPRRTLLALVALLAVAALALGALWFVVARLRRSVREVASLGQYTLEEFLGEGGMGRVYRARHALLLRPTAIKILRPDRVSAAALARFEQEVQLTARLSHPNTIELWDYGRTPEDLFYCAMEYLDGGTLEHLVACAGPLPPARAVHILRQVCHSLREAHALGLVHRDVKPMNIMLCERGGMADCVKVLDFGLARDVREVQAEAREGGGGVAGTPLYIAPELLAPVPGPDAPAHARGAEATVDARVDLYALGGVAFKLLTGRDLFPAGSVLELCARALNEMPARPSSRAPQPLPDGLDELVLDLLAKDPAGRPRDIDAVLARLDALRLSATWTEADARAWWRLHATELRAARDAARGPVSPSGKAPRA